LHIHAFVRRPHSPDCGARFSRAFAFHFVFDFLPVTFAFIINPLGRVVAAHSFVIPPCDINTQLAKLIFFWKQ
jgi:hypothetical protein